MERGLPSRMMVVTRQIAQEVVRRHREKDRQGEQPCKPVIPLCPIAVLGDELFRKQQAQQRPPAVARHGKGQQRTDADAHIIVDKPHHRAEQHHAHQAAQAAGQHRHHYLHHLERHEQQPAGGAAAGHKGLQPLLGG